MNIFLSILIRQPYFSPIRATYFSPIRETYFFSFRAIIYIPRKAEAEDEKLDTTEHRLSSLISIAASRSAVAEKEEIKRNKMNKTMIINKINFSKVKIGVTI